MNQGPNSKDAGAQQHLQGHSLFAKKLSLTTSKNQIRPGTIEHVHIQDVPNIPRGLLHIFTWMISSDGVSPVVPILTEAVLVMPKIQPEDPFEVATKSRWKAKSIMQQTGVSFWSFFVGKVMPYPVRLTLMME